MNREKFLEKLDDFDFDSFGKDNNFDNSEVYDVVKFFANKIYNDFEKQFEKEQNANLENEIAKSIIIEGLRKENTRLKKQLSKDHHIECSCSFCKPVV